MQFKSSTIATIALASFAAATPARRTEPSGQCSTGTTYCCNSVQSAQTPSVADLLTKVGVNAQDIDVPVGVTCGAISVIGIGGNSCTAQPVCCTGNNFNGVVVIGCSPITINL